MPKKKRSEIAVPETVEMKVDSTAAVEKEKTRASRTRSHSVRSQKTKPEVVVSKYEDLQLEIARMAYFFWEQGGHKPGNSVDDWLKAEQQVLSRTQSA